MSTDDRAAIALGETLAESSAGSTTDRGLSMTMRPAVLPRAQSDVKADQSESDPETPRYAPVRLLGRGGLGEVTLAHDNDIERPVAVKRLRSDVRSEESVERFVNEIRTVGQLEHPNIAPIHDVGIDDDGHHYFVMRYIDGDTLETIIAKLAAGDPDYHKRYTFEYRTQIMIGVLNAVSYAHSKGIIHRDLKPANVMVGPFGEIVVMDWGIAKKRGTAAMLLPSLVAAESNEGASPFRTRHGSLIGTPAYMSPEQARGEIDDIDERSDIYSLSAMFYELLTLQHYLSRKHTLPEMLHGILTEKHEQAAHLTCPHQPHVPAELSWFVEKGLQKDPASRYQALAEMLAELHRRIDGRFGMDCYITMMKRGGTGALRFIDAHPRIAMTVFIAATALVVFGVVALLLVVVR